ncbi:DUF416 family protein [Aliikangiella sp. IMCC44359]|uniref:DUF416 family protein n=1 Tax=Aliikangiella sp. IMCC44359 TaxID=3459125 RepID=UPI00403AC580
MPLSFSLFSKWQQQLFAAALVQRMLPNYEYFSLACDYGDSELLKNQLDLMWQKLIKPQFQLNLEAQLNKLELAIPLADNFDVYAVYPALDACTGLISLLQSIDEKETRCGQELGRLSLATVVSYIEMQLLEESEGEFDEGLITSHPLYLWEKALQQELFDLVTATSESPQNHKNKEAIEQIKTLVMQDRLSSLAIEY